MSKSVTVVMGAGDWRPNMVFENYDDAKETFKHRDDVSLVNYVVHDAPYDWEEDSGFGEKHE